MQSRSGLLPGLSGSFGSPSVNQNRTWVEVPVDSAPSSSYTRAVRVTVPPIGPVPCSGSTSTKVGTPAATTTAARNGIAAGAIDSAHRATETTATKSAVRGPFDPIRFQPDGTLASPPDDGPGLLTQATVPRRAPQARPFDPPFRREKVVAPVQVPGQDGSPAHRCIHASPAFARPEGPRPGEARGSTDGFGWGAVADARVSAGCGPRRFRAVPAPPAGRFARTPAGNGCHRSRTGSPAGAGRPPPRPGRRPNRRCRCPAR